MFARSMSYLVYLKKIAHSACCVSFALEFHHHVNLISSSSNRISIVLSKYGRTIHHQHTMLSSIPTYTRLWLIENHNLHCTTHIFGAHRCHKRHHKRAPRYYVARKHALFAQQQRQPWSTHTRRTLNESVHAMLAGTRAGDMINRHHKPKKSCTHPQTRAQRGAGARLSCAINLGVLLRFYLMMRLRIVGPGCPGSLLVSRLSLSHSLDDAAALDGSHGWEPCTSITAGKHANIMHSQASQANVCIVYTCT